MCKTTILFLNNLYKFGILDDTYYKSFFKLLTKNYLSITLTLDLILVQVLRMMSLSGNRYRIRLTSHNSITGVAKLHQVIFPN